MSYMYRPLDNLFPKRSSLCEYTPGKVYLPIEFSTIAPEVLETTVRRDDVWLLGYPRVGQTWCQEIIWLIVNNLNFNFARASLQYLRAPRLESSIYANDAFDKGIGSSSVRYLKTMRSPRTINSHLPFDLLPIQLKTIRPKIIYLTRNPKDVWCSYYPALRAFFDYNKSFEEGSASFCEGKITMGCPIDHALPFWHRRNEPHVLFLMYEDLRSNTKATIKLIADFLDRPLKRHQIEQIYEHVSLENMKVNPAVNMELHIKQLKNDGGGYSFIGDGIVGGWRDHMTQEISEMFDEWILRKTDGTGLRYKYC